MGCEMVARLIYFFFQAEGGIRYIGVTGVQTCALPICRKFCAEDRIWRISIIVCATVGGIVVIVLVIWVTYKLIKILCAARENTVDNIEKALLYDN